MAADRAKRSSSLSSLDVVVPLKVAGSCLSRCFRFVIKFSGWAVGWNRHQLREVDVRTPDFTKEPHVKYKSKMYPLAG